MIGFAEPRTRTYARNFPDSNTLLGAARLFFRFGVPQLLTVQFVVFLLWRMASGAPQWGDLAIALGIAAYWPFQEWMVHAIILHVRPRTLNGVTIDPFFAKAHRYHHQHPWLLETTFVPMRVIAPLVPVNIAFWWFITPNWALACTGIMLFTLATLVYEWIHYLTHTGYRPKSNYLKTVYRNHHLHHFKNDNYWHSFTAPPIDTLFRTAPPPKAVGYSSCVIDANENRPDEEKDYSPIDNPASLATGSVR